MRRRLPNFFDFSYPELRLISITQAPEPEPERKFFEKPLFLWSAIILTGIILLLICIRMLNELKKK